MKKLLLALLLAGCDKDRLDEQHDADKDGFPSVDDCDDTDETVYPGAPELCDDLDNDCDTTVDENPSDPPEWFADRDGDGYGDDRNVEEACDQPVGFVADDADCDDALAEVNPGAVEVCNEIDDDCDGYADRDAVDATEYFLDADGDGYGLDSVVEESCSVPEGYTPTPGDCDDGSDRFHPNAEELDCTDPSDYNCDGSVQFEDLDADSFAACEDCNDADPAIHPLAEEICDDANVDEDCNALADDADPGVHTGTASNWYFDGDGDGYAADATVVSTSCDGEVGTASAVGDCNDADPAISPAAVEVCDANDVDEDCNGVADDAAADPASMSAFYADADGDGYGDPAASSLACEQPAGLVELGTDCNDADAGANPGAAEVCGPAGVDEDCDGLADDADPSTTGQPSWYEDADGDGYGDDSSPMVQCEQPVGAISTGEDCDDTSAAINPGATELCDAGDVDEDCDGLADDADDSVTGRSSVFVDADLDGYGGTSTTSVCDVSAGYSLTDDDCDDSRALVSPAGTEVCDVSDLDEDCDGLADDADPSAGGLSTVYADADGDGYGSASSSSSVCDLSAGLVANDDDCDDTRALVSPAGTEVCDAADLDEDCDGAADDADSSVTGTLTWYYDRDSDGYGDPSVTTTACAEPANYCADNTDCDDRDAAMNPAATEVCTDGEDNDCDGEVDCGTYAGSYSAESGSVAYTKIYTDTTYDYTGTNVVSGDFDGDGVGELGVLSTGEDEQCANCGTAWFYEGALASGSWSADTYDVAQYSGSAATYQITSMAALPDIDGDGDDEMLFGRYATSASYLHLGPLSASGTSSSGYTSLVTGTSFSGLGDFQSTSTAGNDWIAANPGTGTGSAVVYAGTTAKLTLTGATSGDSFGKGVAGGAGSDVDGDGLDDLAISAPAASSSAGKVYIVEGSTTWSGSSGIASAADATFTGESAGHAFGSAIALPGDTDGDGYGDLVVSAYQAGSGQVGKVYVFLLASSSAAASTADTVITGNDTYGGLGHTTPALGDLDADGTLDVLLGTQYGDGVSGNDGTVHLFYGPFASGALTADSAADALFYGVATQDFFGSSVAILDDLDGDGSPEWAAGAIQNAYSTSALASGAAYVFPGQ